MNIQKALGKNPVIKMLLRQIKLKHHYSTDEIFNIMEKFSDKFRIDRSKNKSCSVNDWIEILSSILHQERKTKACQSVTGYKVPMV